MESASEGVTEPDFVDSESEESKNSKHAGKIGLAVASASLAILSIGTAPFLRRFSGAPYVSSSIAARNAIGKALREHNRGNKSMRLVDLGSGSGEVVLDGARAGFSGTGYELNVWLVLLSRWRAWKEGLSARTRFVWGDMWKADLKDADAVVMFGVPGIMERAAEKVTNECSNGCIVCCNTFPLRGLRECRQTGGVWFYVMKDDRYKKHLTAL